MRFLTTFLVGLLLLVPAFADAATTSKQESDAKTKLNELRVLIVKAQEKGIIVPISTRAMVGQDPTRIMGFTVDLTDGATGFETVALQGFLGRQGYFKNPYLSWKFDDETKAALAAYQKDHDISPAVGYFGPKTRAYINALPVN